MAGGTGTEAEGSSPRQGPKEGKNGPPPPDRSNKKVFTQDLNGGLKITVKVGNVMNEPTNGLVNAANSQRIHGGGLAWEIRQRSTEEWNNAEREMGGTKSRRPREMDLPQR